MRPLFWSSLMWWDRVAGEMARASRAIEQPSGQLARAIFSSSSKRLGSDSALRIAVRWTRVRRKGRAVSGAFAVVRRSSFTAIMFDPGIRCNGIVSRTCYNLLTPREARSAQLLLSKSEREEDENR